jgi:hypothetical protein
MNFKAEERAQRRLDRLPSTKKCLVNQPQYSRIVATPQPSATASHHRRESVTRSLSPNCLRSKPRQHSSKRSKLRSGLTGLDKYRRTIADVLMPDGTNVNHTLVKDG